MTHPRTAYVLRPRDVVTELFARALDGNLAAEDNLRCLAPADALADAALEAVVVAEIDARFRADPDGADLPPTPPELLQRILAVLDTAQAD